MLRSADGLREHGWVQVYNHLRENSLRFLPHIALQCRLSHCHLPAWLSTDRVFNGRSLGDCRRRSRAVHAWCNKGTLPEQLQVHSAQHAPLIRYDQGTAGNRIRHAASRLCRGGNLGCHCSCCNCVVARARSQYKSSEKMLKPIPTSRVSSASSFTHTAGQVGQLDMFLFSGSRRGTRAFAVCPHPDKLRIGIHLCCKSGKPAGLIHTG